MSDASSKIAHRTGLINPFRVMDVLRRARELEAAGVKVVHMEVGEPDFSTAAPIVEAARQAMTKGLTHYSASAGIPPLREAIAEFYRTRHGVTVNAERIFITPGASGGLNLLANLLINPGDGVLLPDPAYPCNRNFINLVGGIPQLVPVTAAQRFQPDPELLDRHVTRQTTGLWLASPGNPTGTVIERAALTRLVQWAEGHDYHLLMDEIYQGLHYVEDLPTVLAMSDQGFVVNSFSKYFGMTGWRIGWIVVPEGVGEKVDVLCQNLFIAASTISQYAALAAFAPGTLEILEQRRQEFRRRRDYLQQALQTIGFSIPAQSEGAFYLYAGIDRFSRDSEAFCRRLLEQHGVAITPGTDFGDYNARHYVRFAYTTSLAELELGVDRLAAALA